MFRLSILAIGLALLLAGTASRKALGTLGCDASVWEAGVEMVAELTESERTHFFPKGPARPRTRQIIPTEETLRAAYAEVLHGTLSTAELATLIMRWQLATDLENPKLRVRRESPRIFPLLDDWGRLTPFARRLLLPAKDTDIRFGGLTSAQISQVEQTLRKAPALEQSILVIPLTENILESKNLPDEFRMMRATYLAGAAHLAARKDTKELGFLHSGLLLFAAPLTVHQAYIDARFGKEQALHLSPRFGVSSSAEIIKLIDRGERPLGLSFPGLTASTEADGISTNLTGFTLHDIFHALLGSEMPSYYRQFLVHFHYTYEHLIRGAENADKLIIVNATTQIDPKVVKNTEYRMANFLENIIDIAPPSSLPCFGTDECPSFSERLASDFGPVRGGYGALIVLDLVGNAPWYRNRNLNPEKIIEELGPDAVQLARELRHSP